MPDPKDLEPILKAANEAVKNAKITDKDLKVKAFKFSLNFLYEAEYGEKKGKK